MDHAAETMDATKARAPRPNPETDCAAGTRRSAHHPEPDQSAWSTSAFRTDGMASSCSSAVSIVAREAWSFLVVALLSLLFAASCTDVQSGSVVVCENCGTRIRSNTHVRTVPFWEADSHRVNHSSELCQACGLQLVEYKISDVCAECGRVYRVGSFSAPRKDRHRDRRESGGFCSRACERKSRIDRTIEKVGHTIGDKTGRFVDSLIRGVRSGSQ